MKDKDNQPEFEGGGLISGPSERSGAGGEGFKKLRKVFGIKQNRKTDYEVFKEWHDNWLKEKKENKPPE